MELQYLPLDLMLHAIPKATYLQLTITTLKLSPLHLHSATTVSEQAGRMMKLSK